MQNNLKLVVDNTVKTWQPPKNWFLDLFCEWRPLKWSAWFVTFAWFPVTTVDGKVLWMQWVECRVHGTLGCDFHHYEYRKRG